MNSQQRVQLVIVDPGRWHGVHAELADELLVRGAPPAAVVVVIRESRPSGRGELPKREGAVTRDRAVVCRYVTQIESQVFYSPVPGQHSADPPWASASRAVRSVELSSDGG